LKTSNITADIVIPATAPMSEAQNAEDFETVPANGQITITSYIGSENDVRIPDRINGLPVTSIDYEAFADDQLTSVTIPHSITFIEHGAFDEGVRIIRER
jgi:hypothetical protein